MKYKIVGRRYQYHGSVVNLLMVFVNAEENHLSIANGYRKMHPALSSSLES
jgi:hypothetical protein